MYETPEGYLVCVGVSIARTGEMLYGVGETPIPPGPDGTVKVLRDEKEVFRPETIASFQGKSFTIYHPEGFVAPENWQDLTVGTIQNVRRGEGTQSSDLVADILVTTREAIGMIRAGVREVSCGYEAEYIETGVGQGVQKNIIGNHVALVDQGRAGEAYAITDHKRKGSIMKFTDKLKAIFDKAQDEAEKVAKDEFPEKKEEKAKDDLPSTAAPVSGYDEMVKAVKDLSDKVEAMKPKDAMQAPGNSEPAEPKADDAVPPTLEERMKKMEDAVATLVKMQGVHDEDSEESEDEDMEESEDEDKEEAKDEDKEEKEKSKDAGCMVGDTVARIEILAPGLKAKGKDAKSQALKACYQTKDGKSIIERFTGGKEVDYKNEILVDAVFIGASEVLKGERAKSFAGTRTFDFQNSSLPATAGTSPEEINKKMEEHYNGKK